MYVNRILYLLLVVNETVKHLSYYGLNYLNVNVSFTP